MENFERDCQLLIRFLLSFFFFLAAVVEFAYEATADDELTLQIGQVVKVTSLEDEGWWKGELNGKQGMFPNNFVKKLGMSIQFLFSFSSPAYCPPVTFSIAAATGILPLSSLRVKIFTLIGFEISHPLVSFPSSQGHLSLNQYSLLLFLKISVY